MDVITKENGPARAVHRSRPNNCVDRAPIGVALCLPSREKPPVVPVYGVCIDGDGARLNGSADEHRAPPDFAVPRVTAALSVLVNRRQSRR